MKKIILTILILSLSGCTQNLAGSMVEKKGTNVFDNYRYYNVFENNINKELYTIEITKKEYEKLGKKNPKNPELYGYTWLYSLTDYNYDKANLNNGEYVEFVEYDHFNFSTSSKILVNKKGKLKKYNKNDISNLQSFFDKFVKKANAAIAYNTNTGSSGSGTSLTYAHTVPVDNPILFVAVRNNVPARTVTGVTYAGDAMTQAAFETISGTGDRNAYLYYMEAPTTGNNNVVVSISSSDTIYSSALSYTGVAQSSAIDDIQVDRGGAAQVFKVTATSTVSGAWGVAYFEESPQTITEDSNTTQRAQLGGVLNGSKIGDTGASIDPVGGYTLGYTAPANSWNWAGLMAVFKPAGGATDSCTYGGSGDWTIDYSDNCNISSSVYVNGDCYLNYDGAGSFAISNGSTISCGDIYGGAGFNADICNTCVLN